MKASALFVSLAVLALLAACGKDRSENPEPAEQAEQARPAAPQAADEAADEPAGAPQAAAAGPGAGFDMAALAARLQGAWVLGGSVLGAREAWQVQGDKVVIWDGQQEKTLELAVTSPCTLETTERGADGSSSSTTSVFVFDGDTLYKGLGSAGLRHGQGADEVLVACMGGSVYTYRGGACTRWKQSMFGDGKWDQEPAQCTLSKQGEAEVFEVAGPRGGTVQTWPDKAATGVFMTEQMAGNKADKFGVWGDARTALPAR